MERQDHHEVVCATCGSTFEGFAPRQALRCASEVFGDDVTGHYGSFTIDMERWTFPAGRPEHVKEGTICDSCTDRLAEEGLLVHAGANDLW